MYVAETGTWISLFSLKDVFECVEKIQNGIGQEFFKNEGDLANAVSNESNEKILYHMKDNIVVHLRYCHSSEKYTLFAPAGSIKVVAKRNESQIVDDAYILSDAVSVWMNLDDAIFRLNKEYTTHQTTFKRYKANKHTANTKKTRNWNNE